MQERSMCSTFAVRVRGSCSRALLLAGAVLAGALPAKAQPIPDVVPRPRWTAEVTPGVLVEPYTGGGSGRALAVTFGRDPRHGMWSPSILLAAARVKDVGASGDNRFIIDRDWAITAVGVDAFVARNGRLAVSLGAKGGVLWDRHRQAGQRGTPQYQFGSTNWEMKAGLIMDTAGQYRVGEHVSLASRVALVEHVFTDDLVGHGGALASLGLAFSW